MTDPSLQAMVDVDGALRRIQQLQQASAESRRVLLEHLVGFEAALEQLRRGQLASADTGPTMSVGSLVGGAIGGFGELLAPLTPEETALAEDRAEWDAAPRW